MIGLITCVEHLLSTPDIDVNIKNIKVSGYSLLNVFTDVGDGVCTGFRGLQ